MIPMLSKLICLFKGHQRGKLVERVGEVNTYRCPRCTATWSRKVKA